MLKSTLYNDDNDDNDGNIMEMTMMSILDNQATALMTIMALANLDRVSYLTVG